LTVRPTHPRLAVIPDPSCADEATGQCGCTAGLGRAAHGRHNHGPMSQSRLSSGSPARRRAGSDVILRWRGRMSPDPDRPARRRDLVLSVEVFQRRMRHGGASWRRRPAAALPRELGGRMVRRGWCPNASPTSTIGPAPVALRSSKPGGYVMRTSSPPLAAGRPSQARSSERGAARRPRPAELAMADASSSSASPIPSGRASPRCSRRMSP
jgi:hypothetical protein